MSVLLSSAQAALNQISAMRFADVVDILIVAFLIYQVIGFINRTNMGRVAVGIVVLLLAMWISGLLGLNMLNFLLRNTVGLGLLALVVLFQPELRRALERVGSGRFHVFFAKGRQNYNMDAAITQVVVACTDLSRSKTGALITFERNNRLTDQISTGTRLDANTTAELLKNIFYPKSPLHDGAVVIREGRIAAAGCMLPLSSNVNLSQDLGMRHRAGIGMSERSDAVTATVSEESGSISVAVDGMLKRHLDPETLEKLLRNELIPQEDSGKKKGLRAYLRKRKNDGQENADQ